MAKLSKKYQEASKLVEENKLYDLAEAIELVRKTSVTKFDATVEVEVGSEILSSAQVTEPPRSAPDKLSASSIFFI